MSKKHYEVHAAKSMEQVNKSEERVNDYIAKAKEAIAKYEAMDVNDLEVTIGRGNTKLGAHVASVSVLPIFDCGNCEHCSRGCYDWKMLSIYPTALESRAKNHVIFKKDPEGFFNQIVKALTVGEFKKYKLQRWNVGGDIVDAVYFRGVVFVAEEVKDMQFLIFTKRFDIVNKFIADGGAIPENLKIVFSGWPGLPMDNPYDFPVSSPVFADGTCAVDVEKAFFCPGGCEECGMSGLGCWRLKKGESVIFNAH